MGRHAKGGGAVGKAGFEERTDVAGIDTELLKRRISELALAIPGTPLQGLIDQLYEELEAHGISFRPTCYLADEWGCPGGVPVIGSPFYLARPELTRIESEMTGLDVEDEAESMTYLRHEAGHAFKYAYRLYQTGEWRRVFGSYAMSTIGPGSIRTC